MLINRIKFPCKFFDGIEQREAVTVFQLGLGSCGKVVSSLDCELQNSGFGISQGTELWGRKAIFLSVGNYYGKD